MNWMSLIFAIVPHAVLAVQTLIGDKASGKTKQQMALDMTNQALLTAIPELSAGNAAYAQAAASVTELAIDQAVDITKAAGTYAKATAIASAAQQDVQVAAAVDSLIQSVQNPTPTPAPAA